MGRLILLVLFILAALLVWKAFGPSSWKNKAQQQQQQPQRPAIKGPDDDEEFLWNLEKQRFKERRAKEREAQRKEEERRRRAPKPQKPEDPDATGEEN